MYWWRCTMYWWRGAIDRTIAYVVRNIYFTGAGCLQRWFPKWFAHFHCERDISLRPLSEHVQFLSTDD